ncbi:MAG: hypothetical protein NW205_00825 [Hyphomicrobiaceae bacterium]|nr:hypothetical protein [Hyphomicrobiaceae bacterium]
MSAKEINTRELNARDLTRQLEGYALTTAEILYRLPDHPSLLQTYIWQDYDLNPEFPNLRRFLDFWQSNLDGKLFKVSVCQKRLVSATEVNMLTADYRLN